MRMRRCPSIGIKLEHRHKRFLRNLHRTELAHALLALLLLLEELLFTCDIAAVTLGQNVLAHRLYCFTSDDFPPMHA